MGRYINCEVNGESKEVYKYAFGDQPSEMYRIFTELGIGEYHLITYAYNEEEEDNEEAYPKEPAIQYIDEQSDDVEGDILILIRSDIERLNEQIDILAMNKRDKEDEFYMDMIEAICDFMNAYSEQDRFTFISEF